MPEPVEDRFQNLHEFVKAARINLNRNVWDYLIGGSETETTVARGRRALDALGFRPRGLCDVDCSGSLFGRKLRIPVLLAPVGSLEPFEPGGSALQPHRMRRDAHRRDHTGNFGPKHVSSSNAGASMRSGTTPCALTKGRASAQQWRLGSKLGPGRWRMWFG